MQSLLFPMLTLFSVAAFLYCHNPSNLSGEWILDDKGTITMHPVVAGVASIDTHAKAYEEIWKKDYWGHDDLKDRKSHKSWRPLCTATYYWNRIWAGGVEQGSHSYYFHLVDRLLHAIVTAFTYPVSLYVFRHYRVQNIVSIKQEDEGMPLYFPVRIAALSVGLLFAAHPVHCEAVANTTGRAEVLCAFFYFVGFCVYAKIGAGISLNGISTSVSSATFTKSIVGVIILLVFTMASMLSKEHGITLPIMVGVWDAYAGTNTSIVELWTLFQRSHARKKQCLLFIFRMVMLLIGCLSICIWRLSKNGESNPDFVCDQNPAACEPNRLYRFFHFSFLWCFNFWLLLFPSQLSPDWSGNAIPLLGEHWATDARFPACILLWYVLIFFLVQSATCAIRKPFRKEGDEGDEDCDAYGLERRTLVTSFVWMLLPFTMSSNLFVYVGFVVADRTLYLPSFGYCLLLVESFFFLIYRICYKKETNLKLNHAKALLVATTIMGAYISKQQVQTERWSKAVLIWGEAYRVNAQGCLTPREYGMSLVNAERNRDAIKVLTRNEREELYTSLHTTHRFAHRHNAPREQDTKILAVTRLESRIHDRFKLVTALGNIGECDRALSLIDETFNWIYQNENDLSKELQDTNAKNKAYFFVAKSRCASILTEMAQNAYAAIEARPNFPYSYNYAATVSDLLHNVKNQGLDPNDVKVLRTLNEDGQGSQLSFALMQKK
uniref:DUF1736 domain-containing protein n=1 Tax=Chaetoceros debilis TaxID=122233 RepID=A0A7S3PYM5_9STRA|mmetsp:Transcript_10293/g.15563  ORF Transcript_10293/g.15563 Transcript_10293/m.15563 type:complete len:720 (+) Transcript_10293:171-2330(+)|eukprot:CAMPEP_0194108692 /NCGR_PEP_ID=MMETSP0150-20130528/8329_1 /TAXON_ID=122233 /ORGANISM="Chaetoceros debilis, Strain MM31A-1" /LENGTH=719 /DNA_ID=CAMNT_0038797455 /DNA_START=165 /DNA_END=2324 /DNA_ORIENTATION=+